MNLLENWYSFLHFTCSTWGKFSISSWYTPLEISLGEMMLNSVFIYLKMSFFITFVLEINFARHTVLYLQIFFPLSFSTLNRFNVFWFPLWLSRSALPVCLCSSVDDLCFLSSLWDCLSSLFCSFTEVQLDVDFFIFIFLSINCASRICRFLSSPILENFQAFSPQTLPCSHLSSLLPRRIQFHTCYTSSFFVS